MPAGKVNHIVGVAVDIRVQVKAREELDEYRRQMEKRARDAEVGVLSATMGRQIAEPLSVAQLTLEKLLGDMAEAGMSPDDCASCGWQRACRDRQSRARLLRPIPEYCTSGPELQRRSPWGFTRSPGGRPVSSPRARNGKD